jgi:hypothetical protein
VAAGERFAPKLPGLAGLELDLDALRDDQTRLPVRVSAQRFRVARETQRGFASRVGSPRRSARRGDLRDRAAGRCL